MGQQDIQALTDYNKAKQIYNDDLRINVHYFRMTDAVFKSQESESKKMLEVIGLYLGHQVTHEPKIGNSYQNHQNLNEN